jgi:hypothetical protein
VLLLGHTYILLFLLATAVHVVELVRIVLVRAFTAIELVLLPDTGRVDEIVASSAIDHILALVSAV